MRDLRTYRRLSVAALLLKDALRGARFALRRGRDLMEPPAPTPAPVGDAARVALAGVDRLAFGVEDVARKLSRALFDLEASTDGPAPILTRLRAQPAAELVFAQLAYRGAARALRRFGAQYAMVSEATAADCFGALGGGPGDAPARAARLYRALRSNGFIHDVVGRPADGADLSSDRFEALTIFSVLLWMLAEPGAEPDRGDGVLADCCDLVGALSDELREAEDDVEALRALFAAYADKV